MKASEKSVVFLGDSVCAGLSYDPESAAAPNYRVNPEEERLAGRDGWKDNGGWAFLCAGEHPESLVINYAVCGGAMGTFIREDDHSIPSEYEAVKRDFPGVSPSLWVIEVSFNDLYCKYLKQGIKEDSLPAFRRLLECIAAEYPKSRVLILIAPERYDEMYDVDMREGMEAYIREIREICAERHLPLEDLYHDAGFPCSLDGGKTWPAAMFNERDGVHPSRAAQEQFLYPVIRRAIEKVAHLSINNPLT